MIHYFLLRDLIYAKNICLMAFFIPLLWCHLYHICANKCATFASTNAPHHLCHQKCHLCATSCASYVSPNMPPLSHQTCHPCALQVTLLQWMMSKKYDAWAGHLVLVGNFSLIVIVINVSDWWPSQHFWPD